MPRSPMAMLLALVVVAAPASGMAEEAWNPFKERDQRERAKRDPGPPPPERPPPLQAMDGVGARQWQQPEPPRGDGRFLEDSGPGQVAGTGAPGRGTVAPFEAGTVERQPLPPLDERSRAVERGELQPITAADGSGLPLELWQGIDARNVEGLVTELDIPPRSPALNQLWRRLWTAEASPQGAPEALAHFEALRLEALYRSGLVGDLTQRLRSQANPASPLLAALSARVQIGAGNRDEGCRAAREAARALEMPKPVKTDMLLLGGYCAGIEGNKEAAGLAADLARGEGAPPSLSLAALDAFAAGQPLKPELPRTLTLMDYRFLALAGAANPAEAVTRAEPALLAALAMEEASPPLRIATGEAAARINALETGQLADIYRSAPAGSQAGDLLSARGDPVLRRAQLFKAIEGERTPMRKARLARTLLDEGRRAGLATQIAGLLARPIEDLRPVQEIGWFAETAIEINLAAGRYDQARTWAEFAARDQGGALQHWLVLIDLADARHPGRRGESLVHAEQLALRGRLPSDLMHRLATVLDALDYQIPIPLWEAASRTPQPTAGHLPATGVLPQLQDAAKQRQFARTVLIAMRAIGPNAADGAHMIALGDAIRALRRAGLEVDARRLALEAVLSGWPRMAAN